MVALHTALNIAEETENPAALKIFLVDKMMELGWEEAMVRVVYNRQKAAMDAADIVEKMMGGS